jgi:hypothetical protein
VTVTAAAATVGAVLVFGPGGAAAAGGPGYALAASDRTRAARRAGRQPQCGLPESESESGCPPGSQPGRATGRLATGLAPPAARRRASQWARLRLPARGQSHPGPELRSARRGLSLTQPGSTVTQTVARLAARARGSARRRDNFDIQVADSPELES